MGLLTYRGRQISPLPKICHTYPAMKKRGTVIACTKKIQKIYEPRDTPPEFCWHQHFSSEIRKFCYIKKYRYRLYFGTKFLIFLTFLESLGVFFNNLVIILLMSAKRATSDLLKITVFWNKIYNVIIPVDDVTNKI